MVFSFSPVSRDLGGVAGVPAAAWQWALLAIGFLLLATSLVLLVRSGRFDRRLR